MTFEEFSGDGEYFFVLFEGESGGDEAAGFGGGFDDEGGFAESGDDAVALGEVGGVDFFSGEVFADDDALAGGDEVFGYFLVFVGVDVGRCRCRGRRWFWCGV